MEMRTVSSRVDNTFHDQIINRCNGIGCSPSQYIKDLIAKDLQDKQGISVPAPNHAASTETREVVRGATSKFEYKDGTIIKATAIHYINKDGKTEKTVYPARNTGEKTRVVYYDK